MTMPTTGSKIGIVGAGLMGTQLAGVVAHHGYEVVLVDPSEGAIETAHRRIRGALREASLSGRTRFPSTTADRVVLSQRFEELRGASIVVDNSQESLTTRPPRIAEIGAHLGDAILAINTSCIPIASLAEHLAEPSRCLGAHFMNPIALRDTVEVISTPHTSAAVRDVFEAWLRTLGKVAVHVRDAPGFVSNRVLMLMVNEAVAVLEEGTADAATVDRIFEACMGHALGPLRTIDLIGVDTIVASLEVLEATLRDSKFRPRARLLAMRDEGHLGRKSGRGFYEYE